MPRWGAAEVPRSDEGQLHRRGEISWRGGIKEVRARARGLLPQGHFMQVAVGSKVPAPLMGACRVPGASAERAGREEQEGSHCWPLSRGRT